MVDLTFTPSGGQFTPAPIIGQNTPSLTPTGSSPSLLPTPPAAGLFPFQEISLVGLGLNLPQNPDDCAALAAEVSLLLQASLAKNHENSTSVVATGLEADLENAQKILAQISTLQTETAAAQAAATKDQTQITQDQSDVSSAQTQLANDQSNAASWTAAIATAQTELAGLDPNDPNYEEYKMELENAITTDTGYVADDDADESTQNQIISSKTSDIQSLQSDLTKQNKTVGSDNSQIGQLQSNFITVANALVADYAQLYSAQNGRNADDNQDLYGVFKDLDGLPVKMANIVDVRDTSLLDVQEERQHIQRITGVATGLALGVADVYGNLQDLVPPPNDEKPPPRLSLYA